MKAIQLICALFLIALSVQGKDSPNSFLSLPQGNWINLEYITFFPQTDKTTPDFWRAENIRKITLQARISESTRNTTRWKVYLLRVYHNRSLEGGTYRDYFDTYYSPKPHTKKLLLEFEQKQVQGEYYNYTLKDTLLRYTTQMLPTGLKNTTRLTRAESTVELNLTRWLIDTVLPSLKQVTCHAIPGLIYADSTQVIRIINGSFNTLPNTLIRYYPLHPLTGDQTSVTLEGETKALHPQPDSSYNLSCFLSSPAQIWLANLPLHVLPGDTLTIRETGEDTYTFEGKNADSYRFWQELEKHNEFFMINNYQSLFRLKTPRQLNDQIETGKNRYAELFSNYNGTLHPYWKKSAKLNLSYWEITLKIRNFLLAQRKEETPIEPYAVEWEKAPFTQVNPFTDYIYQPENYDNFLNAYFQHKAQQLNEDNLTNKAWWEYNTDTYYLQKQLFSGYPRLARLAENLKYTLEEHELSYSRREYQDFSSMAADPLFTPVRQLWRQYEKLEPGQNIRHIGLSITDSLPLKKKADGYILLSESYLFGDPQDFTTNEEIKRILKELGVADKTTLCYFRPESRKQYLPDSLREQHPYRFIPDSLIDADKVKLNLSPWAMILMKNDGTIISREISKTEYGIRQLIPIFRKAFEAKDETETFSRETIITFTLTLCFCLGIVAAILYFQFGRIKRTRQLAELKLKALRSQMNPHFLFNAIGSIQSLIVRGNNDTANRYLTDFSKLLRNVLESSDKQLVPLSDELARIRLYLQLEQLRTPFETSIQIKPSVNLELEEIPGMLLQPIVENAVIHGIVPQGGGKIEIMIYKTNDILYCEIADNGKGFETCPGNPGRFGLRNTEERLHLLNKQYKASVGIVMKSRQEAEQQSGCRVIISIPV